MPVIIYHYSKHCGGCIVKILKVIERRDALVRGNELVSRIKVHGTIKELHPN